MMLDTSFRVTALPMTGRRGWDPVQVLRKLPGAGAVFSARQGVFLDIQGTQPATSPGQPIALMRDLSGKGLHAFQPNSAMRPLLGRHPARGIINLTPADTTNLTIGPGWATLRASRAAAPDNASGESATLLTATETSVNGAFLQTGGNITLNAGTYTVSATVKGSGFSMWQIVETSVATNQVRAWMNAQTGVLGSTARESTATTITAITHDRTPIGDGWRHAATFTLNATTTVFIRAFLTDSNAGNTVTLGRTLRIEAPQIEGGNTATSYQRRVSGLNVTEQGQRDCWYLAPDGVDDWLQLAQPFAPQDGYSLLAVGRWATGFPAFIPFGSSSGVTSTNFANGNSLLANGGANNVSFPAMSGWPVLANHANRVEVVRVAGANDAQSWRNGLPYPGNSAVTGQLVPLAGFDAMFRTSSTYSAVPFYGGALIPAAISTEDRVRLQRYFANLAKAAMS